MSYCRFHVEELQMVLLVCDDDVHVVAASQTVVHCAQQAICIGRQVDADDLGGLVRHNIKETRVL